MTDKPTSQLEKFKEAARQLEANEDEEAFDAKLRKMCEQKRAEKPNDK